MSLKGEVLKLQVVKVFPVVWLRLSQGDRKDLPVGELESDLAL